MKVEFETFENDSQPLSNEDGLDIFRTATRGGRKANEPECPHIQCHPPERLSKSLDEFAGHAAVRTLNNLNVEVAPWMSFSVLAPADFICASYHSIEDLVDEMLKQVNQQPAGWTVDEVREGIDVLKRVIGKLEAAVDGIR